MQTGIGAWIANHEFDFFGKNARIDLPGGWYWDISPDKTGYLKTPDGSLCVGYDINQNTIQFGGNGTTLTPGLNLWTIQEMGEKFARENFMDEAVAKEYDAFAKTRMEERKSYEKGVREEMKGIITMNLTEGRWTAHVDTEAVKTTTGIETKEELTRQEGIMLFNQMSEAKHVMPLRDPMGYMIPDNNLYSYIKDQYDFQYNDMIDNIDAGFINGTGRGCEAILDKLDAVVCKNIREYCLPDGVNYRDLRFVTPTPELQIAVNDFVKQRVTQTVNYENRRSHNKESLARDKDKYLTAGEKLRYQIGDMTLPPLDVYMEATNNIEIEYGG